MKRLSFFLLYILMVTNLYAQYRLNGVIRNESKNPIVGVVLELRQDTTLVGATVSNAKGEYAISGIQNGNYIITMSCYGYETISQQISINGNLRRNYTLELLAEGQIGEVTVTADRSQLTQTNATGTTYFLSQQAKAMKNPYQALQEIPKLVVNPTDKTVTMTDGTKPLILINGVRYNGGIDSIDPSLVEDVEVIESPSVRYLNSGYIALLNIKTKRTPTTYQAFDFSTRHSLPILYGNSSASYRIGNQKMQLSLTGQHWYFHHDDSEWSSAQQNIGYLKNSEGTRQWNGQNIYAQLNLDWFASDKDYLVFNSSFIDNPSKYTSTGQGLLNDANDASKAFTTWYDDKVNYFVNSNNLYYRHTFKDNVYLENTLRFNLNGNQTQGERKEDYADWQYHNLYDYDNFRYSGGLETHFVTSLGKQQLELGNELSYLNDKLKQEKAGYPTFRHQNTNEYFYAGLSGNLSKNLSYSLSAGMNYISRKADNIRYNYFRPVESVSLSYRINSGHAITFSHSLTNSAPQVGQLNPYNTSTDSLRVVSGNPYLLPQRIYNWQIRYSFSKQGFSLMPSLAYQLVTDEINNIGYTDPQSHIYTQTYENYGHFSRLTAQVTAGYQNYKWGGINLTIANLTNYFEHQSAKNQFQYMLNFYGYQKRWSWNGNLSYFPKQYGIHSKTISRGAESEFTVTYSLNDQWALNAGMRYFLGMLKSRVYTDEDTYHSQFFMDSKDRRYKVLIGISYSFRKRRAPNRQTKYLNSTESGIDL